MFNQQQTGLAGLMEPKPEINPPKTPAEASGLKDKWEKFLTNPQMMAFFGQTAINLMQPKYPGQSGLGHLGRALGGGAEAAGRVTTMQQGQQQLETQNEQKEREIGVREQANVIGAEQNTVMRERTAAETATAAERNASAERIAKIDYDKALATTTADASARMKVANIGLFETLAKAAYDQHKAEADAFVPTDANPTFNKPLPSIADLTTKYLIVENSLKNGGRLDDGVVKDDEVLKDYRSKDPNRIAAADFAMSRLSDAQVKRINAARAKDPGATAPPAVPPAGSAAPPAVPGSPLQPTPPAKTYQQQVEEEMSRVPKPDAGGPKVTERQPVPNADNVKKYTDKKNAIKAERARLEALKKEGKLTQEQVNRLMVTFNQQFK